MTVSVGCHFRTTYLPSTSSWRENIKYTQIMKHIEKLIRYSLPEPDHYLSYGGALSIWSRTFYDEARFSLTKSFVCRKHAIRIFGCSCYDGNWWESVYVFTAWRPPVPAGSGGLPGGCPHQDYGLGPETSGREDPSLRPASVISPSAISLGCGSSDLRLYADKIAS